MKTTVKATKTTTVRKATAKMAVSESNITKAAMRLLSQRLVSSEIHYVQRVLGAQATQEEIDTNVLGVRKLPWSSIVIAD